MVKVTIELENGTKKVFERECVLMVGGTLKGSDRIRVDKAILGKGSDDARCSMLMSLMDSVIDTTNDSFSQGVQHYEIEMVGAGKETETKRECTDQKSASEQIKQWLRKLHNQEGDNNGEE